MRGLRVGFLNLLVLIVVLGISGSARAQSSDSLGSLKKQAEQLFEAGKYDEALTLRRALAVDIERAEMAAAGKPGVQSAGALGTLAWYALFARKFDEALAVSERAVPLAPDLPWIKTNRAHALLFLGRVDEARALYLAHKGKRMSQDDDKTWEDVIAEDFEAMRKAGLDHPAFVHILAALEIDSSVSRDDLVALNQQIVQLYKAGQYAEAGSLAERYVALVRQRYGEERTVFATAIAWLGMTYRAQGRYAEAEPLFKRDLAITEKVLGPDHEDVGTSLTTLALLYYDQGHYAEAEPLYKRALVIREKALGPDHPAIGISLNNLAVLYERQGRYAEAERLLQRSLSMMEKQGGTYDPALGLSLNNLAALYESQGRYADAEPLHKRALAIREKALGPDHPDVGQTLINLGLLYQTQGRTAEAEPIYKRALAINEKAFGPDHPTLAVSLGNLALVYQRQGRYAEAEPLLKRALAIDEKALGPDHPSVGTLLNNLAALHRDQRRFAEAEPMQKRALAISEKAFGLDHPDVGAALINLAAVYYLQGRFPEAEPLYQRTVSIFEKALGPDHPDVVASLGNLARLYFTQRDWARAADYYRRGTAVTIRRAQRGTDDVGQALTGKRKGEAEQHTDQFWTLVKTLSRLTSEGRNSDAGSSREMFQTAQWAHASEAAASVAQMAVRGAMGDVGLSPLVRERQDLVAEWQRRDGARSAAVSQAPDKRDRAPEAANVARLAAIDTRIADIDKRLAADFPEYAALTRPQPLSVEEVQSQLRADEALVLFLDTPERLSTPEETFIWVVTKTDARWVRSELGTKALTERVAALRCGLDYTLWEAGESAERCRKALGASPREETVNVGGQERKVQVLPFDLARAHELYTTLLGPVEDMIKNPDGTWKHLLVVPSGPLTSLPFGVLVTEGVRPSGSDTVGQRKGGGMVSDPEDLTPQDPKGLTPTLADYRNAAWLGARQAITVLPSVASLKSLRQFAKTSRASKPYLGVGNPLLDGPQDDPRYGAYYKTQAAAARGRQRCAQGPASQQVAMARGRRSAATFAKLFRGAQADIESVRAMSPLPETADELCEVARRLGVPESEILLGARASEGALKDLSDAGRLSDYAILHFATHGALSGQVQGAAEPGLILTPPAPGTSDAKALDRDDGYLTASEIATLKLDADWVILSACNTAGPAGGETAEALSGLARAFFYAGARALLVSHWEVGSDAAVKLTTRAFAELKSRPGIGRAEALRLAMRELIERGSAAEAHPAMWAPFVVVGEGGR